MLVEIEKLLRNWRRCRLVVGVMVRLKVRVLEGFFNRDALHRVESEQLLEKVERKIRRLGEECPEVHLLLKGERPNVLASATRLDAIVVLHRRRTENVEDKSQLVVV